jgi:hypothetical protein
MVKTIVDRKNKFDEKVAFLSTHGYNLQLLDIFPNAFIELQETLYSYMTGYIMYRNHFLYELTDEVIQDLVTGGVLEHGIHIYNQADKMQHNTYHNFDYVNESKVLTLEDFSYGFTLWIIACLICMIVFLMELTTFYIRVDPFYHIKNVIGVLAFLSALTVYNNSHLGDLAICNRFKAAQNRRASLKQEEITSIINRNRIKMTWIGKAFLKET